MDLFTFLEDWKHKERIVQTEEDLKKMLNKLSIAEVVAFDTETTTFKYPDQEIIGISFATDKDGSWYIPLNHITPHKQLPLTETINKLRIIFEDPSKTIVAHNAKFDLKVVRKYDLDIRGHIVDTYLMAWLWNENISHKLSSLSKDLLGMKVGEWKDFKVSNPREISMYEMGRYSRTDSKACLGLYYYLFDKLREQKLERAFKLEMALLPIVAKMEENGVLIDVDKLKELGNEINNEAEKYRTKIWKLAGEKFNVDSPDQLRQVLFNSLEINLNKYSKLDLYTPSGKLSTDVKVLRVLAKDHEIVDYIVKYRKFRKLETTYIEGIKNKLKGKTVYAQFKQLGAESGRFSCIEPNLQNIPRGDEEITEGIKIRNIFKSPDGCRLIVADYNQIELRVLAHFCQDKNLMEAFKSGKDIHTRTASMMFGITPSKVTKRKRFRAKALNFGLVYGMGIWGLANRINVDEKYAKELFKKYFSVYNGVKPWVTKQINLCHSRGYIRTLIGRKRRITAIDSEDLSIRKAAERKAVNAVVQGSAADIIKGAMIKIGNDEHLRMLGVKMLIQVHDELVFSCPKDCVEEATERIRVLMETPFKKKLRVPLTTEIKVVDFWGEAK